MRLLTAHRAKGLEWRLVVVAHVQAGGLARPPATLDPAPGRPHRQRRTGPAGQRPGAAAEERRLFYVACTRARQRLVVTAVASPEDDGEQPSRFLGELGVDVSHVKGRPKRPLSLAGLVSELRRTVADPDTSEALRGAAARRLARLAQETVGQPAAGPDGGPRHLVGHGPLSLSARPVRDPDQPVPRLGERARVRDGLPGAVVPARRGRRDRARAPGGQPRPALHALAERVASGELTSGPGDVDALMEHVDAVWDRLALPDPVVQGPRVRPRAAALTRFLDWHYSDKRELVGIEERFATVVELPDGEQVQLTGYADRLERDADGNIVVVDLKTGAQRAVQQVGGVSPRSSRSTSSPSTAEPSTPARVGRRLRSGGAELVQLGALDDGPPSCSSRRSRPRTGRSGRGCAQELGLTAAADPRRGVPGRSRAPQCRDCPFVPHLPGQECRVGAVPVSPRTIRDTPEELQAVMRTEFAPAPSSGRRSPRHSRRRW